MDYDAVLVQVLALLQREKRLSYRVLKRRFGLDDETLEDLKEDLIYAKQLAVDEDSRVLVWIGDGEAIPSSASPPARALEYSPHTYTPPHLTAKILASRPALEGERKQVTVLFADIKGSTELIQDLDPEAAQHLLDPVLQRMMEAVHRFEGTVNQVLGDGIMALFGAPIAHEDHALRACYAALAMQAAMQDYTEEVRHTRGLELRIRVGLNSGEVVVRTIGNDLHMDYSAVGQTTHLAARMEQLATPGTTRLTAATLRLVEGLVRVTALGPVPVKGLPEPVEVFELVGASGLRRRLQAAATRGLTRFVGRDTEMEALRQALERARAGHGQIMAVIGEPGVGKSRLGYEFKLRAQHDCLVLETFSVSHGKAYPYLPLLELLHHYFQLTPQDDTRRRREQVTGKVLTLDRRLDDTLPYILALLGDGEALASLAQMDPQVKRQRTFEAVTRLLLRESLNQPLLVLVEDLHWLDSETDAWLHGLSERVATARLLLLVNYRPEYQHPWGSKSYYTQLRLAPLGSAEAQELLTALLGDDVNLQSLKQLILVKTEGNPFFIEEIVQTLVEQGFCVHDPAGGAARLTRPLTVLQLPPTVQGVLAARIDRLPTEEKALLQTLAVLGKEFSWSLLTGVVEQSEAEVHRLLAHLQAAEFLYEQPAFPEPEYIFKHALTQEVAYNSLLLVERFVSPL